MAISAARRDRYRSIANRARAIPGKHGLREHSASVVIAATPGTYTGDGARTESVLTIVEAGGYPPKIRWLKDEDRAIGQLPEGTVEVGPITPSCSSGGTELARITGADMTVGQVRLLRITGPQHPDGADYKILSVQCDHALHITVRAAPTGSQA